MNNSDQRGPRHNLFCVACKGPGVLGECDQWGKVVVPANPLRYSWTLGTWSHCFECPPIQLVLPLGAEKEGAK